MSAPLRFFSGQRKTWPREVSCPACWTLTVSDSGLGPCFFWVSPIQTLRLCLREQFTQETTRSSGPAGPQNLPCAQQVGPQDLAYAQRVPRTCPVPRESPGLGPLAGSTQTVQSDCSTQGVEKPAGSLSTSLSALGQCQPGDFNPSLSICLCRVRKP